VKCLRVCNVVPLLTISRHFTEPSFDILSIIKALNTFRNIRFIYFIHNATIFFFVHKIYFLQLTKKKKMEKLVNSYLLLKLEKPYSFYELIINDLAVFSKSNEYELDVSN